MSWLISIYSNFATCSNSQSKVWILKPYNNIFTTFTFKEKSTYWKHNKHISFTHQKEKNKWKWIGWNKCLFNYIHFSSCWNNFIHLIKRYWHHKINIFKKHIWKWEDVLFILGKHYNGCHSYRNFWESGGNNISKALGEEKRTQAKKIWQDREPGGQVGIKKGPIHKE